MLYKLVIPKYGPLMVNSVLPPFMDIICYVPPPANAFRKTQSLDHNGQYYEFKKGHFFFQFFVVTYSMKLI